MNARTPDQQTTGVIVVDHGSRREESNAMLPDIARLLQQQAGYAVVEPAHMELAEPSIQTAFDRCVAQGARCVVVFPYFLLPGRHWKQDIPELAAAAARRHPGVSYLVTAPLGIHRLMATIMQERIEHCWQHAHGWAEECPICAGTGRCQLRKEGTEHDR